MLVYAGSQTCSAREHRHGYSASGHNECMGTLEASQNEIVSKPNAGKNEPVGDQATLDDIKDILLNIESFLKSEKGQARIHELHKSRQAMARPEPLF